MEPEEDFENWSMILTQMVELHGDYVQLIDGYCRLIEDFLNENSLKEPLKSKTELFLTDTVPNSIQQILNLPYISGNEEKKVEKFLISSIKIIPWLFMNDRFDILDKIQSIFDPESNYYVRNFAFDKIMQEFIKNDDLALIMMSFDDIQPQEMHFKWVFRLLSLNPFKIKIKDSRNVINHFLDFINANKDKSSDLKMELLGSVEALAVISEPEDLTNKFLLTAENLLYEDKVYIQIIGANILNSLYKMKEAEVKKCYKKWSTETKLGEFLLANDINQTLLKVIKPVLATILNADNLNILWRKAVNAHSSQKEDMLSLLAESLTLIDGKEARVFLDKLLEEKTEESLDFIFKLFTSHKKCSELASNIFSKLICIEGISERLAESITNEYTIQARKSFVLTSLKKLTKDSKENSYAVLMRLITTTTYLADIFPSNFTTILSEKMDTNPEQKTMLLKIFIFYVQKVQGSIDPIILKRLLETVEDDELWQFINKTIEKHGEKALNEEAYQILFNKIMSYNFAESREIFATMCNNSVLYYNMLKKNIVGDKTDFTHFLPQKYKINKVPEYVEVIENILMHANDNNAVDLAMNTLQHIFRHLKNSSEGAEHAINLYNNTHEHLAKMRILSTLYQCIYTFYSKVMPEDYNIEVHKDVLNDMRKISYIKLEGDKRRITINPKTTVEDLKHRIAIIYHISKQQILSITSETCELKSNYQVKNVKNNEVITVKLNNAKESDEHYEDEEEVDPYLKLVKSNFQENLFELLDNEDKEVQKLAYDFLCILPNVSSVETLLSEPEKFAKGMQEVSLHKTKYMLEIVANKVKNSKEYGKEFVATAAGLLVKNIHIEELSQTVLYIINSMLDDSFKPYINEVIDNVLECFDNQELVKDAAEIIQKLQKIDSQTAEILYQKKEIITNIIKNCDDETWLPIKEMLLDMPQDKTLEVCLNEIESDDGNIKYFIELFNDTIKIVSEDVELTPVLSKCIKLLQNASIEVFGGLCNAINEIFIIKKNEISKYQTMSKDLIDLALKTDNEQAQKAIFELCVTLGTKDLTPFEEACNIDTDMWSISPSRRRRSELDLSGLRNLGATCYMNSIIQQLFSIKPFVAKVVESKLEKEGHKELQELFTTLEFTKKKAADTEDFVNNWKGWGNSKINRREQEDATEFFQMILDQLPDDCNSFFKGKLRNVMEGKENSYKSSNEEDFYTLQLDIKGCKDIEDSFRVFTQSETFPDYKADGFPEPFELTKYTRIEKAPKVLALQLKRFDYDLQTGQKIKINDKFEFSDTIDISPIMIDNSEEELIYELHGVVVHRGTAMGGHYTSIIKEKGEKIVFNDQEVYKASKELEEEILGTNKRTSSEESSSTAYILLYTAKDFENEAEIAFNEDFVHKIEKQNEEFIKEQAIFSESFSNFAMKFDNPLPYLINIFVHSSLENKSEEMKNEIQRYLEPEDNENVNKAADFFIKEFEKVYSALLNCSSDKLTVCVSLVIKEIVERADINKSKELCSLFVEKIPNFIKIFRQLPLVCDIIHQFAKYHTEEAEEMKFGEIINNSLEQIYSEHRTKLFLETANISSLLSTILLLSNFDTSVIIKYAQNIIVSNENSKELIKVFSKLSDEDKFDIIEFINSILSKNDEESRDAAVTMMFDMIMFSPKKFCSVIELAESNNVTSKVIERIQEKAKQNDESVQNMLLENISVLAHLLGSDTDKISLIARNLIYIVFPEINNDPREKRIDLLAELLTSIKSNIENDIEENTQGKAMKYFFTIKIYTDLIIALSLTNNGEEYSAVCSMIRYIINSHPDLMNIKASVDCLLVFDRELYEDDIYYLIERLQEVELNPNAKLTLFETLFNKVSDLSEETQVVFFSSNFAFSTVDAFLEFKGSTFHNMMNRAAHLCAEIDKPASNDFIERIFSENINSAFDTAAEVLTNILSFSYDIISKDAYFNYINCFINFITNIANIKLQEDDEAIFKKTNLSFCKKACNILIENSSWFGNIDVNKVMAFLVAIAFTEQESTAIPMALFVDTCLPLLDIDKVVWYCEYLFQSRINSEQGCGLLFILLECKLMTDGDVSGEYIEKYYRMIERPETFLIFAAQKIEYGTKWHKEIAKKLMSEEIYEEAKLFVSASLSVTIPEYNYTSPHFNTKDYYKWTKLYDSIKTANK